MQSRGSGPIVGHTCQRRSRPSRSKPALHRGNFFPQHAERNARRAAEAFYRCQHYVEGWLAHADPTSGLIPRNLREGRDFWNGRDSTAVNYPFMVLTASLTDPPLMEGRAELHVEVALTPPAKGKRETAK